MSNITFAKPVDSRTARQLFGPHDPSTKKRKTSPKKDKVSTPPQIRDPITSFSQTPSKEVSNILKQLLAPEKEELEVDDTAFLSSRVLFHCKATIYDTEDGDYSWKSTFTLVEQDEEFLFEFVHRDTSYVRSPIKGAKIGYGSTPYPNIRATGLTNNGATLPELAIVVERTDLEKFVNIYFDEVAKDGIIYDTQAINQETALPEIDLTAEDDEEVPTDEPKTQAFDELSDDETTVYVVLGKKRQRELYSCAVPPGKKPVVLNQNGKIYIELI